MAASSSSPTLPCRQQGHGAPPPTFVLLDNDGHIADRPNATTARAVMSSGETIEVTFHIARPPLFSYFSVHSPGLEPADFPTQPRVISAEADLILLRVSLVFGGWIHPACNDYFIYRAHPRRPTLDLLPHPNPYLFVDEDAGLLRLAGDDYIIAALRKRLLHEWPKEGILSQTEFDLYLYSSKAKEWTSKVVVVEEPIRHTVFPDPDPDIWAPYHQASTVITLGGPGGAVGWVDLWRGILVCDVLDQNPVLRDIPLPKPASGNWDNYLKHDCPYYTRNITVSQCKGFIKYIEMELRHDGWKATTWSMPIPVRSPNDWRLDYSVDVTNLTVDCPGHLKLLPKLEKDKDEVVTEATLGRLDMGYPAMSIDDDTVYFLSWTRYRHIMEAVVAVDMGKNILQEVAKRDVKEEIRVENTYLTSEISKYLNETTGGAATPMASTYQLGLGEVIYVGSIQLIGGLGKGEVVILEKEEWQVPRRRKRTPRGSRNAGNLASQLTVRPADPRPSDRAHAQSIYVGSIQIAI